MLKTGLKILLLCFLYLFSSCREVVIRDLSERRANQALLLLAEEKVKAKKSKAGEKWNLSVKQQDFASSLKVLKKFRFFQKENKSQSKISSSFIPSRAEQELEIENLKTKRLEKTIESFSSVLEVHVHLNLQEKRSQYFEVEKENKNKSASVFIVSDDSQNLEILKIKKLVSGASGVSAQNVNIVVQEEEDIEPVEEIGLKVFNSQKYFSFKELSLSSDSITAYILFGIISILTLLIVRKLFIKKYKSKSLIKDLNSKNSEPLKIDEERFINPEDIGFGCRIKRRAYKRSDLTIQ